MAKPKPATEEVAKPEEGAKQEGSMASEAATKKRSMASEAAEFEATVSDMKAFLAKQPTVRIFIPLEPGEPKGTLYPVEMNGYKVKLPKNVYVEVPQPIAEIVMNSLNVYEAASAGLVSKETGKPLRLDLADGQAKAALDA